MKTPEDYTTEFYGTYETWVKIPAILEDGAIVETMFHANQFGYQEVCIARGCRAALANIIRRAIEEAHAAWMANVPGGLSYERLAEIKGKWNTWDIRQDRQTVIDQMKDAIAHIQHQAALIEDIAQLSTEYTEARERIRKEAFLECKQVVIEAVNKWIDELNERYRHSQTGSYGPWLRDGIVGAITNATDLTS